MVQNYILQEPGGLELAISSFGLIEVLELPNASHESELGPHWVISFWKHKGQPAALQVPRNRCLTS